MNVNISGPMAHLTGNWTRTEMTDRNLESLAVSLQQLRVAGAKNLRLDCGELSEIDASGLQLLYIWLRCSRSLGIEIEIINLPDMLRKTLLSLMQKIRNTEKSLNMAATQGAVTNTWTRRPMNENQRHQGNC